MTISQISQSHNRQMKTDEMTINPAIELEVFPLPQLYISLKYV